MRGYFVKSLSDKLQLEEHMKKNFVGERMVVVAMGS